MDDWRAVLLESGRGWMIRLVLEEGYRLSKIDELNGKVFIISPKHGKKHCG